MFGYVSLRRNIKSKDSWKTILSGDFLFADYNIDSSWSVGRRRNSTLLEESLFKLQPREQTWHIITKGQAIRVPCTLPYQPHRHSHNPVSEKKLCFEAWAQVTQTLEDRPGSERLSRVKMVVWKLKLASTCMNELELPVFIEWYCKSLLTNATHWCHLWANKS